MGDDAAAECDEVAAGIVVRDAQVLLCHRSPGRAWYPDLWDLPGGHIQAGETPRQALARELLEELGIAASIPPEPEPEFARLAGADYNCRIWVVTEWAGTPANLSWHEHDDIEWWSSPALAGLKLAHPDYPDLIRRALA